MTFTRLKSANRSILSTLVLRIDFTLDGNIPQPCDVTNIRVLFRTLPMNSIKFRNLEWGMTISFKLTLVFSTCPFWMSIVVMWMKSPCESRVTRLPFTCTDDLQLVWQFSTFFPHLDETMILISRILNIKKIDHFWSKHGNLNRKAHQSSSLFWDFYAVKLLLFITWITYIFTFQTFQHSKYSQRRLADGSHRTNRITQSNIILRQFTSIYVSNVAW